MSNKYGARKAEIDGYTFDSQAEARRYRELRLLEAAGVISGLEVHPSWPLEVNGVRIGRYSGDFRYVEQGRAVVEDVKGVRTRDYLLRKRLMWALHGIAIQEVAA